MTECSCNECGKAARTDALVLCPVCESKFCADCFGMCWCQQTKAAAEYLVKHDVHNPQGFLDAYEQAAKIKLADMNV